MWLPGAQMSVQLPRLLYLSCWSVDEIAPTVMADGTHAGEKSQDLFPAFPAATTTVTPESTAASTAVLKA